MTTTQKINTLTWFDLINKLKSLFTEVDLKTLPTPPTTGNYKLESVNGVVTWVLIAQ